MFKLTTATKKIARMKAKVRAVQGGTSASKTISILLLLIQYAQTDKKPTLTSVVAESVPHLKRGSLRDFKKIMKAHSYWKSSNWNETDKIYTFETGSQIEFFGADDDTKLRGARRDRLFMNECNNIPFLAFEELEVRTREFVYLDWNPTNEFWFYTDVQPLREDVEHLIVTYKDNEALEPSIVDSIESRRNRKQWFKVYGLGELGEVEGKIYRNWTIVDDIPDGARLLRYGLDFGYSNDPSSLVAVYKYNDGYVLDEIFYQKGLSNRQIAEQIKAQETDVTTVADSAEPKSIDEIRGYGIDMMAVKKGADSVRSGIQFVQDQTIFVTKRSTNVIKEYRNYMWKTNTAGEVQNVPDHLYSHAMDGIRYAFTLEMRNEDQIGGILDELEEERPLYSDIGL
jgi:phage terminase large subunit